MIKKLVMKNIINNLKCLINYMKNLQIYKNKLYFRSFRFGLYDTKIKNNIVNNN